ncbi:MAG: hypothetical protein R2861_03665 [Desulfobacterales bacterium]
MKDLTFKNHPVSEAMIGWAPEHDGAFIALNGKRYVRFAIEDAVLWDLFNRFAEPAELMEIVSAVFKMSTHEASELLQARVMEWKNEGLLR